MALLGRLRSFWFVAVCLVWPRTLVGVSIALGPLALRTFIALLLVSTLALRTWWPLLVRILASVFTGRPVTLGLVGNWLRISCWCWGLGRIWLLCTGTRLWGICSLLLWPWTPLLIISSLLLWWPWPLRLVSALLLGFWLLWIIILLGLTLLLIRIWLPWLLWAISLLRPGTLRLTALLGWFVALWLAPTLLRPVWPLLVRITLLACSWSLAWFTTFFTTTAFFLLFRLFEVFEGNQSYVVDIACIGLYTRSAFFSFELYRMQFISFLARFIECLYFPNPGYS